MKGKILSVLASFLAAVVMCQLSGCSLIGLGIGAKSDASKPDQVTISGEKLKAIKLGTPINVILKSGNKLSGKYSGLARVSQEEYAKSYAKCREQNREEIMLPALNESVTIVTVTRKQYECEFLGFDHATMWIRLREKTISQKMPLKMIRNIMDSNENIIGVEIVKKLISED